MDFVLVVICADHFSFCLPVTSLTNLRDSAATPRSQEMSQDAPGTPTTFVMAATLTSEADLKAWYLANNPTLRSHGLSCPPALYKEMKRDLRGRFRTTVAIVPAIDEEEMKRLTAAAKPVQGQAPKQSPVDDSVSASPSPPGFKLPIA